jgi:hypothetical protein
LIVDAAAQYQTKQEQADEVVCNNLAMLKGIWLHCYQRAAPGIVAPVLMLENSLKVSWTSISLLLKECLYV